ncbi:MAG: RNA 3'-terminal phosphate cyclase [Planctomycetota bacterium]|nr:RNA 3'-terminal phosphate cyclase [Planctomycetota bacterium]
MLVVDGSLGEGGGQILRTSVALSMVTGTPFRIERIRAHRTKPGLKRQHLTAIEAAREVCGGRLDGARIGSQCLTFEPGEVRPGAYTFSVGTAGSTTLIFQTLLPALAGASGRSTVALEGGTHNPLAPPFDFLEKAFLPVLERQGLRVTATLDRPGFYPAGGGRFTAEIEPVARLGPFELLERGGVVRRRARAVVSALPRHIAEREVHTFRKRLGWPDECFEIVEVEDPLGPGNVVTIEIASAHVTEVFTAFGKLGRPAEAVAADAVRQCRRYLGSSAPVGEYLTDQLLLPLALAGAGSFRSTGLSRHATTLIDLLPRFLDVEIRVEERGSEGTVVSVEA